MVSDGKRNVAGAAVLRDDITAAIRHAVVHELAAVGYGRLSIEAVARRAGVGKTAIYRRWSSKLDLVLAVVTDVAGQSLQLPDTGSLSGDLTIVLQVAARALRNPLASQIIPDLLAEASRNPQIAQTLREALRGNQRDVGVRLIGRAIERGELPGDIDPEDAVDLIVGPLYWRLAIARSPVSKTYLARLAAATAAALRTIGSAQPAQSHEAETEHIHTLSAAVARTSA